ncbi:MULTISPECIES: TetR/AcrR family transcriptional regulator [Subtercola]|uniref:TetR/AcrR family transcriptional regulator n=1 Tax=Subtercola vilae TaxID=2056433 RepID=A0A4T2BNK5_9MICO|nr:MULTISPECIES: TetR/AcrR family transcriptional regulator [Subtercola]MEA9985856.1 TetR/AcrR family transcriptional regulator [Subtercola sp. RTI3]TIH32292.1 TetR/AcrR family transcriptional regulator [Subtercola vilae]
MPSAPSARDRVLDAFENILITQGERTATLDAVAAEAGVSKGGLLYHFGSKDALVEGLIDRLGALVVDDLTNIRTAPAGVVDYFLRSSVNTESPLDRAIIAATRLAQGSQPKAQEALKSMQRAWFDVVNEAVGDEAVARTIMLVSDGLYYNSALLPTALSETSNRALANMDELVAMVSRLTR